MSCVSAPQYQQDVAAMRAKALRRGNQYQAGRLKARQEHADACRKLKDAFQKAWEAQTK